MSGNDSGPALFRYAVNALVEFPAPGSTAHGRATRSGEITTPAPATEANLRAAVAGDVAKRNGCAPADVTFVEFVFTELPTEGGGR